MIQINNLSFAYSAKGANVLNDVSLHLKAGKICGLLGKNGAGKSTLINLLAGLLLSKPGMVNVLGRDALTRDVDALVDLFVVPDEVVTPNISISEFVKLFSVFYPNFSKAILDDCLKEFEVEGDPKLMKMSLGERKKAYVAFAFATRVRLLIMDEPTNGLDIPSKAQFRKLVSRYMTDESLFLISTHQVHDVQPILDHLVVLADHSVAFSRSVEELAQKYAFDQVSLAYPVQDVIYSEPSAGGNAVIRRRQQSDAETGVNVELLFNAILAGVKF